MERKAEIETEREVLKRIVALLFSFAGLAERASVRSYPVRCLVLWALRRAEAVARDWIAEGSADDTQPITPMAVLHRNSQAEAMHLAQAFRALAHMLKRELRLEARLARRLRCGEANRSKTATLRRMLLATGSIARLASTMSGILDCLRGLGFLAVPRLDTS